MLDADSRVSLVNSRVRSRRRKAAKRAIAALSSTCAVLVVALVGIVAALAKPGAGDVVGLYGATLKFSGVGGYVLVGVICFVAAVAITLGCISYRRKSVGSISTGGEKKDVDHV